MWGGFRRTVKMSLDHKISTPQDDFPRLCAASRRDFAETVEKIDDHFTAPRAHRGRHIVKDFIESFDLPGGWCAFGLFDCHYTHDGPGYFPDIKLLLADITAIDADGDERDLTPEEVDLVGDAIVEQVEAVVSGDRSKPSPRLAEPIWLARHAWTVVDRKWVAGGGL